MQGCKVTYDNTSAQIHDKDGNLLLVANKSDTDRLWLCDLGNLRSMNPPITSTSSLAQRFRSVQEQVNYLQLILRNRPTSTITRALRKNFIRAVDGWPTISSGKFERYAINIPAISAGNLRQLRHGTRSTRTATANFIDDDDTSDIDSISSDITDITDLPDELDDATPLNEREFDPTVAYIKIIDHGSSSDAKGPYRTPSIEGHQYDFVTVYDNFIHVVPMKTPNGADQLQALEATQLYYDHNCAHPPRQFERYDNAGDNPQVRAYLLKHKRQLQLCMTNVHRALKAERAIQDWQNFRLSARARWGAGYPVNYWHKTIPADLIVLNHLRPSTSNPDVSAYHAFHGKRYNYSNHPILPAACLCSRLDRSRFKDGYKSTTAFILGPDLKRHHVQEILVRDNSNNWCTATEDSFVLHLPDNVILPRLSPIKETGLLIQDLTNTLKRINPQDVKTEANGESLVELGRSLVEAARIASSRLFFDNPTQTPTTIPSSVLIEEIQSPTIQPFHDRPPSPLHLAPEQRLRSCMRLEGGIGTTKHVSFLSTTPSSPDTPTAHSKERYPGKRVKPKPIPPPDPDPPQPQPRSRRPPPRLSNHTSSTNPTEQQDHSTSPQRVASHLAIPLIIASAVLFKQQEPSAILSSHPKSSNHLTLIAFSQTTHSPCLKNITGNNG